MGFCCLIYKIKGLLNMVLNILYIFKDVDISIWGGDGGVCFFY